MGKLDNGVILKKYSVPNVRSERNTGKGVWLKPYAPLPSSQWSHLPWSQGTWYCTLLKLGGNSPTIHHTINMKQVIAVTTGQGRAAQCS